MTLVIALAPALTGLVRKTKARLTRRRGASVLQPYFDLARLARKEAIVADSATSYFRVAPYLIFASTWVAAALVPTFATGLLFSWSADLIAIVALLGFARFALTLAGMDVGTSFGGLGASREAMFATLAEPAMMTIVFCLALLAGSTQLSTIAEYMTTHDVGLRVTLGMALVALVMVALAENGRVPIDNPATHLELTMVHEAMVLEYSGRHLALIELAAMLKLLLYVSFIGCVFAPVGARHRRRRRARAADRRGALRRQTRHRRRGARDVRDLDRQDASVPRAQFPRRGADAGSARRAAVVRVAEPQMNGLAFDVSHLLAGGLVLISFMLLYQTRLYSLLNVYAVQAFVLSPGGGLAGLCAGPAASLRDGGDRVSVQGGADPLSRCIARSARLGIARDVENVVGVGPTMLLGLPASRSPSS